jgi:hypothetical protein
VYQVGCVYYDTRYILLSQLKPTQSSRFQDKEGLNNTITEVRCRRTIVPVPVSAGWHWDFLSLLLHVYCEPSERYGS